MILVLRNELTILFFNYVGYTFNFKKRAYDKIPKRLFFFFFKFLQTKYPQSLNQYIPGSANDVLYEDLVWRKSFQKLNLSTREKEDWRVVKY